jgi:hypothetical protein
LSVRFKELDSSLLFLCSISAASSEAIRSVTHLVLAQDLEPPVWLVSFEPKGSGALPSPFGSFLRAFFDYAQSKLMSTGAMMRPTPITRVQKNFSAGPCSFSA